MGTSYYLHHDFTRTYINLGKILSGGPRFEGHGDEVAAFITTRHYGTFTLENDCCNLRCREEEEWTEVTRDELIATPEPDTENMSEHTPEPDEASVLISAAVAVFNRVGDLTRAVAMIEAAPELLEACKRQVLANSHTLECICSQGKDRDMGRKPQCCCEALRSTITKAEPEPEPKT